MHRARLVLLGLALALPAAAVADDSDALNVALALETAFVEAAERARDGVVTLTVSGSNIHAEDLPTDPKDFEDFLREQRPEHRLFQGMGSGFIVDTKGTIYTNAHVVNGAQTIEVLFRDGRRGKADVIGADEASDVAVIRLLDPPDDLVPLELADSDAVKVGQFALAFGSPMLLAGSVTVGHVSALHRNEVGRMGPGSADFDTLRYQDFLQVDTPINPGNSGGPLLDIRGRVIGINTAIYASADGLGFSIPINMAQGIGEQLLTAGKVRRAYLGVRMSEMDPDLVELYGLDLARPVVINGIEPGSPAEAGRFKEQDIVLEFGGRPILTKSDLVNAIASSPIGESIQATVYRTDGDEGRMELTVVLVEQTERPQRERKATRRGPSAAEERTLLDSHGLAFSEEPDARSAGAVISQVRKGSHADDAGLKAGDIIVQVEESETEDGADAISALRGSSRPFVPLRYLRDGKKKVTSIERPR